MNEETEAFSIQSTCPPKIFCGWVSLVSASKEGLLHLIQHNYCYIYLQNVIQAGIRGLGRARKFCRNWLTVPMEGSKYGLLELQLQLSTEMMMS